MTVKAEKSRIPLNKPKAAARMAAVQALYLMDVAGTDVFQTMQDMEQHFVPEDVEGFCLEKVSKQLFRDILQGVLSDQREIDQLIHTALPDDWPLTRIDITLRAILRCGAYELIKKLDTPPKVILNEYVEVARDFFDNNDEIRLTNGVLDAIAHKMRALDMNPTIYG